MRRNWITTLAAAALITGLCLPAAASESPAQPPVQPLVASARFTDLPKVHWAHDPVMRLQSAGVIAVDRSARFRPDDPILRSELLKMVLAARRIDAGPECAGVFADVPCWAWYAPYVETAFRMAITDGQSASHFAPDAAVSRQELFTVIVRVLGRRWEAANLGWSEIRQILGGFADARDVAHWAEPALALAVRESLAAGYADGTFRPGATATRAEAATAVSRILLPAAQAGQVRIDGRNVTFGRSLEMTASAFATGEPGVGTETYTGIRVRPGTVAVDPRVIPLGRLLYVQGYGYSVAADIGGAIKGNRIDLFTHDYGEAAYRFGLQQRMVWVLP
ncbi:MAG TPA: S-layer homology domain-containing protein [Symbiobacteriaceae bacterium]|nr:S-layer homology domain-containing protein [Symbiobacteriaceae bacterium]